MSRTGMVSELRLSIGIYNRPGGTSRLIFKKGNVIYRIPVIESRTEVLSKFLDYKNYLKNNVLNHHYLLVILCPKKKIRVLEIGIKRKKAMLYVIFWTSRPNI